MIKVGNQGLHDRCIRLRSHRLSHPVVSGLRQSHSITFSRPGCGPSFYVWFRSKTQIPFNRVSNQNWFLGHDHARLTRLVLRRAICTRINRFRLDLLGAAKVRAAAISIHRFADQEQENKTRGLQEPQLLF